MTKIVFFGTPQFAVPSLQALLKANYEVAAVVTAPDAPAGRGQEVTSSPITQLAKANNLLVIQPHKLNNPEVIALLQSLGASLGVLVAYGHILPPVFLQMFAHGIVNLHPSLLPKYRGPSPITGVLLNGEAETGVSIMVLDEEMDHGPIIAQVTEPIQNDDTAITLRDRLADIGANTLIKSLPDYISGSLKPVSQDHNLATFTKFVKAEDGLINWSQLTTQIHQAWKAYQPWPGVFTLWNGKRLKFGHLEPSKGVLGGTPGLVKAQKDRFLEVITSDSSILIDQLQLEGSRMMTAEEFIRGHVNVIGSILGQ